MSADVLIVGAGVMGRRHAAAVRDAGDRVSVVVDAQAERARALDPDAVVVPTFESALDHDGRFEAAVIATPSALHLEQATALAVRRIPVLIEKPHRIPGQEPGALLAAEAAGARVMVGMSTRHWPGIEAIAAAIREGRLGDVLGYVDRMAYALGADDLPPWYFDASTSGGGILVTNGVHALDRAAAILGPLEDVRARMRPVLGDHTTEDSALIRFRAGRAEGLIELLWAPYPPLGTGLVVTGTRGAAEVRMDGSWRIRSTDGDAEGPPIDIDAEPFRRQWAAFRAGRPGFAVRDLEPTLTLIERLYREADHD